MLTKAGFDGYCASSWMVSGNEQYDNDNRKFAPYTIPVCSLLILAGAYQFTPLKRICIGYCESSMSFFMRRW